MYTFNPTHTPARSLFHSGNIAATRPSMGSWISYGLGTENQNLPGFVVLSPGGGGGPGAAQRLPARRSIRAPASTIPSTDPETHDPLPAESSSSTPADQRRQLDLVQQLNRDHERAVGEDEFLEGRIQAMETAFRMQSEATDAFDIRSEPAVGPRRIRQHALRQRLPPRPPPRRARRPHRPRLLRPRPAVGRPQPDQQEPARPLPRHGPGLRRADPRPQAPRPARRDRRRLGRRVRPHARLRKRRRPRPQPLRLHHVHGRRRLQGRHLPTAPPTNSASAPSRTASPSTTCTPRCCTCWASTTRSSPTATPAAISA